MEIKQELIKKVKQELSDASKRISEKKMNIFLKWMKNEYVNYMFMTREIAIDTLQKVKNTDSSYNPLVIVLVQNIEQYASLQCYYVVACDFLDVA